MSLIENEFKLVFVDFVTSCDFLHIPFLCANFWGIIFWFDFLNFIFLTFLLTEKVCFV